MKNNTNTDNNNLNLLLSKIPSVEIILQNKNLKPLIQKRSRKMLTQMVRKVISEEKKKAYKNSRLYSAQERINKIKEYFEKENLSILQEVINGNGVILHTNLGRAPLGKEVLAAVQTSLQGYTNLEYDLAEGSRGKRGEIVEKLLCALSNAENSLVVNNNAGAIFLILNTLAKNKEVIVSRGELVQIGGGFRISEILEQSGAHLREVGTTNQTFIEDYEKSVNDNTAVLLKVHQSNFNMNGFVHQAEIKELKKLGKKYNLPVIVDLGSGTFLATENFGLKHEPTVQENIRAGADIVCFSTDKLLGGPQGGAICGKEVFLKKISQHPLFRTLRVDKITLTILQEILLSYLRGEAAAITKIPIWKMISCPLEKIAIRSQNICQELKKKDIPAFTKAGETAIGGGSLPGQTLPTKLIVMKPPCSVEIFSKELRLCRPPLLGRKEKELFILDPRCIDPSSDNLVIKILTSVYSKMK
ncbi:L-seryl-tRNA(Sec) selenium transferase [Candidatus Atribacteria bacterium RBG_19FT_COMBO_35_14]|uniref:L-seryl-tRNA(Sec) selenium transferase n=1 Tax=Candidatus Sediminicultor quintus TaxID=1797291 RepID=A0A1F5AAD8_9BACT|nr:MAG: L-seryl-tRNA(Sec) selenium transferase [Candidatus Atribacteria bacterium RBG_19FT_COMBO_35_14]